MVIYCWPSLDCGVNTFLWHWLGYRAVICFVEYWFFYLSIFLFIALQFIGVVAGFALELLGFKHHKSVTQVSQPKVFSLAPFYCPTKFTSQIYQLLHNLVLSAYCLEFLETSDDVFGRKLLHKTIPGNLWATCIRSRPNLNSSSLVIIQSTVMQSTIQSWPSINAVFLTGFL